MTSVTIEFFDLVNCADWFNWQQLPTKSQKGRERERVGHRRVAWLSGRTEANPESPFTASFPFFIFVRPEGLSESAVNYLPSYYDFENHKANKTKGLGLGKRGGISFSGWTIISQWFTVFFKIQNICCSIKLEWNARAKSAAVMRRHGSHSNVGDLDETPWFVEWKEEVKRKSESCQLSWILGKNGVLNATVGKRRWRWLNVADLRCNNTTCRKGISL